MNYIEVIHDPDADVCWCAMCQPEPGIWSYEVSSESDPSG